MKKFIFFLFIFFFSMAPALAEEKSAYLENLKIENGQMTPEFNKYNNAYSVFVDEDITKLNIEYNLEDSNSKIDIINNEDVDDQSVVYINITNESDSQSYKIIINKEKAENVASIDNTALELKTDKHPNQQLILIGLIICWFLIVAISKMILFPSKNRKRK